MDKERRRGIPEKILAKSAKFLLVKDGRPLAIVSVGVGLTVGSVVAAEGAPLLGSVGIGAGILGAIFAVAGDRLLSENAKKPSS